MKAMRIVLTVTDANPELCAELEKIAPRLRAERIRTLATLGIVAAQEARKAVDLSTSASPPDAASGAVSKESDADRAVRFAKSLGDDL